MPIRDENNLLEFHHVGLLTESIESSIPHYAELFGKQNISNIINIASQNVNVCFVGVASNNYIELVQPLSEDSVVYKLLKKKISYYHVGYKVSDIERSVARLEALNYKSIGYFYSEAFEGKRCIFLFSPETHLIELIEK